MSEKLQARKETDAVSDLADALLKCAGPASNRNPPRAIMALFVAAAVFARTENMTYWDFLDGVTIAWNEIHETKSQ